MRPQRVQLAPPSARLNRRHCQDELVDALLAEFDYTMKPHPTIPLIDTKKERYDMWLLKRYGIPFMYWNLMLKGRG